MPDHYTCSACHLTVTVGSYHGSSRERRAWYRALYCRHCGTRYTLAEPVAQFLAGLGVATEQRTGFEYAISGGGRVQHVRVSPNAAAPMLRCGVCDAEGPFGPAGPLTDEEPGSRCPRCKHETLTHRGRWIT